MNTIYNAACEFDIIYSKITKGNLIDRDYSNDLPIYIQTYPIANDEEVLEQVELLANRLIKEGLINAIHIDLYKLVISILKEEDILDNILESESEIFKTDVFEALCSVLSVERVMEEIDKTLVGCDNQPQIVCITGIAQLYPYLRAHNILNGITAMLRNTATILFYPGVYDNYRFNLFGTIKEDNYYRANNMSDINI